MAGTVRIKPYVASGVLPQRESVCVCLCVCEREREKMGESDEIHGW